MSSRGRPIGGGPPACVLGDVLKSHHRKNWPCYETDAIASGLESVVDWRIILRWIVRQWDGGHGLDRSG